MVIEARIAARRLAPAALVTRLEAAPRSFALPTVLPSPRHPTPRDPRVGPTSTKARRRRIADALPKRLGGMERVGGEYAIRRHDLVRSSSPTHNTCVPSLLGSRSKYCNIGVIADRLRGGPPSFARSPRTA